MTETPRTYQMTTDLPDETNDLLTDCEAAAEDRWVAAYAARAYGLLPQN